MLPSQQSSARSREDLISKFQSGGEYSDVVGIYRHFGGARSIKITGRFDSELVSKLPGTLRYIVHNGAGYDQLDIPSLTNGNVQVSNVPTAVDDATSDVALFLLIGAMRRFPLAQAHLDQGLFNSQFPFLTANDPRGKTLGIVGAGGIGRALAYKASHALGLKVIYHNRRKLDPDTEANSAKGGMEYVGKLEELLQQSDVVSLHCPLTPETKGLIGREQLAIMKSTAVIINTARGPIIKEEELASALEEGTIAGAGLDVYESEVRSKALVSTILSISLTRPLLSNSLQSSRLQPSVHPRLLALKDSKALLLPHVGTLSLETQTEMEAVCLRNLMTGLQNGKLGFTVPEQKGYRFS